MSDAVFQRSVSLRPVADGSPASTWPPGLGLLLAVAVSLGLWAGALWIIAGLLG